MQLNSLTSIYNGLQQSAGCSTNPHVSYSIGYSNVGSGTDRINAGNYGVTCTVTDPNYSGTASGTLTINKATPTVSFTSPPASKALGDADFSVSASANSGGTITYSSTTTGVCTVSSNTVHLVSSGTCTVRADVAATTNYTAGYTTTDITVNKATPTLLLDNTNVSTVGQSFTTTCHFIGNAGGSGQTPSGSVTITARKSGQSDVSCTSTATNPGSCSLALNTAGTWSLVASFGAEAQFNSATSGTVSHTVNPIATTTAITVLNPSGQSNATNSATADYGQPVTVSVTVTAVSGANHPPGAVDVTVDGKTCQVALADQSGGVAGGNCAIDAGSGYPDVGTSQAVTASYTPGSANFAASSSSGANNGSLTVNAADTETTLSTSPVNSTAGGNVDLVATVASVSPGTATPAGSVAFSAELNPVPGCGAVVVDSLGKATCTTSFATWGDKTLHATYTPNTTNFTGSASGNQSHSVNAAGTTTNITGVSPGSPTIYGDSVTVSLTVSGSGTPTGTVLVTAGSASCSATLSTGSGSCALIPPAGNPTTLTATYQGDATYGGSLDTTDITVDKASIGPNLTPNPSPSTVGDGVTFTVTMDRPNAESVYATGTTTVYANNVPICTTGNLVDGSASCVASFSTVDGYRLKASYTGDDNYAASEGGNLNHDVQVASTATAITLITPNPATYGQTVTVNVTVTGNATLGAPSGTVTLSGAGSCAATLSASTATQSTGSCQPTGLNAGTSQTLSATYSGDAVYGGSTANGSLTVDKASATVDLGNLGPHTYDTTQKSATCTTAPAGLSTLVTYNDIGWGVGRTHVGGYEAVCTVTDPNYLGTGNGVLLISQATPTITWSDPAAITYGTALSATQLNATANVPGNFAYAPASGEVLGAGSQTLNTSFTPTDANNYASANASVSLSVNVAGQSITFSPPTSGVTGQVIGLSATGGGSGNTVVLAVESGPCGLSGANLTLSGVGTCRVNANQAGNANYTAAPTVSADIAVSKANTTTTLTGHGSNPSNVGQGISVTYTVTANSPGGGTPTGNVSVSDGTDSCTGTVAAGGCTLTPSTPGAKTLAATYESDANYNGSSSAGVSHTVNAIGTSTAVTVVNPSGQSNTGKTATSVYGQAVTVTVTVSATSGATYPPGTVDVSVGGKTCQVALSDQTGGISGGQCTINAGSGFPDVGASQAVTASYTPGSGNFAASASSGAGNGSLTVSEAGTTTTLSTSPVNSTAGGNVDLVATIASVSPGTVTPVGSVAFTAELNPVPGCGAVVVDSLGKATCTTSFATWGDKTISAAFTGNANFDDSASGNQTHSVSSATSTTTIQTLNPPTGPYTYGTGVAVTVGVSGSLGTPTGNVTVTAGSADCTATLTAGEGSCTLYPTVGSPTTLTVTYNGDAIYGGSDTSTPITVIQVAPAVSLTPTPSPSTVGDGVTLNVTVARPNASSLHPAGTVAVKNGSTTLCTTGNLVNGQASCAHSFAATGNYSLTAEYAGDANYQDNTGTASHDVQVASTSTAISTISPNPATYGQTVTVSVTVTGTATLGAPSGTVTLSGAGSCTATLSASTATQSTGSCQPTGLNAGTSQTLSATYSGDAVYGGSTANGSLTVDKASATVDLGNLGPHTYDTTEKSATCATTPDVAHSVEYSDAGSGTGRINAGSYGVTCTVTDPNYSGSDSGTLSISQATQSISFGPLASKTFGDPPFEVLATVPATGAVAIASTTAGVCTLVDHANGSATVTLVGAGACSLRASHPGDTNYLAAPDNDQGFAVGTLSGNPSLGNLGPHVHNGLAKEASCVTVPAGLSVSLTYNSSATPPSNVGDYAVACVITQAGYAGSASGSLSIVKAGQTITFNALTDRLYGSGNFELTATAGSALPVSYTSATPSRCTVSGSTVTLVAVGTCTLNADQAGDTNWNAAAQVSRSFAITAPASGALPNNSGGAPGGAGTVNVSGSAPGLAPSWNRFQFIPLTGHADSPPVGSAPAGVTFPYGLFDFIVNGMTPGGTLVLNVTYPAALPAGTVYWKYGPTADNNTAHWYPLPVTYSDDRRTVTLTIVDGGLGDDDLAANGTVVDQGGPAVTLASLGSAPIPTLNVWGMMVLSLMILMAAAWVRGREISVTS